MVKDNGPNGKSRFSLKFTEVMQKAKVDLKRHEMLINYTTEDTMLINEATSIPWRGGHKKDIHFLQFMIEGTTEEGDIVLDCTATTGEFGFSTLHTWFLKYAFNNLMSGMIILYCRRIYHCMSWHETPHHGFGGRQGNLWCPPSTHEEDHPDVVTKELPPAKETSQDPDTMTIVSHKFINKKNRPRK